MTEKHLLTFLHSCNVWILWDIIDFDFSEQLLMNWKQSNIYKHKMNCVVETICDVVCPDVLWRQTGGRTVSEWKKSLDCKILLLTLSRRLKYLRTSMRKQYLLTLSDQKLVACAALLSSEMSHDSVWHDLSSMILLYDGKI